MGKYPLIYFVKKFCFILQMTNQREFIFVYNAKGGKLNYVIDTIHKYVSPSTYDCNLCQITYDLKMKKAWKEFINDTPHLFKFFHLEELVDFGLEAYRNQLPICFEKIGNKYEVLINRDEMNAFKDEFELINLINQKL